MPIPRSETAVADLDGKLYVIGGYPASRIPSDVVQVYDVRADTWDTTTPLPMPLHHPVAVAVDGTLYLIGGEFGGAGDGNPSVYLDTVFAYSPAHATWEPRAPMPRGRSFSQPGAPRGPGETFYRIRRDSSEAQNPMRTRLPFACANASSCRQLSRCPFDFSAGIQTTAP